MASNISVAITLDNKQYIANIKAADATTQKFAANTTKSLNDINLVSNNLISRIGGLRSALAGLVSATAIQSANNFANAIKDIATTTDISIETILGLSRAFELNGGTAEGAQKSILGFAESIAQARAGNDGALKSFKEIGISIDDLNKNGIEELLKRSISGVAGLSSATARIKNQTDIFTKSAKGVSFGGVQATTQGQVIDPATVEALKSGADASENMKKQFSLLTDALLRVAKPLNDIVKSVNVSVSAFESLIKTVVGAVAVFGLFKYVVAPLTSVALTLGQVSVAAAGAGATVLRFFTPLINIFKDMGGFLQIIFLGLTTAGSAATRFGTVLAGIIGFFAKFLGLAGIVYTVAQALDFLSKIVFNWSPLDAGIAKLKEYYELAKQVLKIKPTAPDQSDAETKRLANQNAMLVQLEKEKKARDEAAAATKAYKDRVDKFNAEIQKSGSSFLRASQESRKLIEDQIELVGKTKEEVEMASALEEVYKRIRDITDELKIKKKDLALSGTVEQKENLGLIDAEIKRVEQLGAKEVEKVRNTMTALQGSSAVEANRLQNLENMTKALEAQLKVQEALSNVRLSIIGAGQDTAFEKSQIGQGDLQKQMKNIGEANRKAGLEASRAFAQAFEDGGDGLTSAQAQQLADGLDAIAAGYKSITDAQLANLALSREFGTGWSEAFANYRNAAENAADQSKRYFETFTSGFEDAFVRMVQTGKLSFKDLANSMIADFARIQAKKALLGIFGMGGGDSTGSGFSFGTLFGSIGKIFGFANGGNPPVGRPSLVGERGPELFVPRSAGTIIPNGASMGGTVNNTAVTYSIQAVDAQSFKSLLARDPEFIHNVAEQGRRSMPIRSRR